MGSALPSGGGTCSGIRQGDGRTALGTCRVPQNRTLQECSGGSCQAPSGGLPDDSGIVCQPASLVCSLAYFQTGSDSHQEFTSRETPKKNLPGLCPRVLAGCRAREALPITGFPLPTRLRGARKRPSGHPQICPAPDQTEALPHVEAGRMWTNNDKQLFSSFLDTFGLHFGPCYGQTLIWAFPGSQTACETSGGLCWAFLPRLPVLLVGLTRNHPETLARQPFTDRSDGPGEATAPWGRRGELHGGWGLGSRAPPLGWAVVLTSFSPPQFRACLSHQVGTDGWIYLHHLPSRSAVP